jgi:hypothetical protein
MPTKPAPLPYYFPVTDERGNAQWVNLLCAHRIAITHPLGSPKQQGYSIYFPGDEEIVVTVPEEVADLTTLLEGAAEEFKSKRRRYSKNSNRTKR